MDIDSLCKCYKIKEECLKGVLDKINLDAVYILWSSVIEELGTDYSDIDVYVLSAEPIKVVSVNYNGIILDIENYIINDLISECIKIKNCNDQGYLNLNILKVLYRIKKGVVYHNNGKNMEFTSLLSLISTIDLDRVIGNYWNVKYVSAFEEIIKLYSSGQSVTGILQGYAMVSYALGTYIASKDNAQVKEKWFYRIFERILLGEWEEIIEQYWKLFKPISKSTASNALMDMIVFCKKLLQE